MAHVVHTRVTRPDRTLVDALGAVASSTLSDAMGRTGAMGHRIRALYTPIALAGPALTVRCAPGDNLMVHKALQLAEPGDVLVVDTHGSHDHGLFGHNMALHAARLGIAGLVIDGSVRDARALRAMPFPVFSVGVAPTAGVKESPGSVNGAVTCGGVVVHPGDIVVGDDDGVAVVPAGDASALRQEAASRAQMEVQQAEEVEAGHLPLEILYGPTWVDDRLRGRVRIEGS